LRERWDLKQMFATAATVMRRRDRTMGAAYTDYLFGLYDQTAALRRRVLRDNELRRLRRSV
jgi:site-specific recombinase